MLLSISLGGEVRPAPHILTLFKTKIADFPTPFKTEFRFLIPCLRHLTRYHTLCKTIIVSSLVCRTYAQAVYRPRKDTLFTTKIDKIDTLIQRQKMIKSIPCLRQKSRKKKNPSWPRCPIKPLQGSTPLREISLAVFMQNITTNHAITYTKPTCYGTVGAKKSFQIFVDLGRRSSLNMKQKKKSATKISLKESGY